MSERQAGYYWVRHWQFHDWHIAEKTLGGGWLLTGLAIPYDDDDMEEIGPRIPTPNEPWATVPVEPTELMLQSGHIAADAGCELEGIYKDMLAAAPKPGGES